MKVLILTSYYEPEIAASIYLIKNLCEDLVEKGCLVDLITPMPTRGVSDKIKQEYANRKLEKLFDNKFTIHRVSIPLKETKSTLWRAIRYVWITFALFWKALFTKTDVMFVYSTPPTLGFIGVWLKKLKRKPVIYNLQDIFPDSLINTGLANNTIIKIGYWLENYIYRNVDRIVVISQDFKKNIMKKGVSEDKIDLVYNWVDENAVTPVDRQDNILVNRYRLDVNDFIISYCGNIGHTQNLEMLIDIAKELELYKNIKFVIVGDGAHKEKLIEYMDKVGCKNVILLPFQPYEEISHVFSLGDIGLIISKCKIGQNSFPSKTWSIMSAGRTVLASFDEDSELCYIINEAQCGLCVPAENKDALRDAIVELYGDKNKIGGYGENGRRFVVEHLSRSKGTELISKVLEM